MIWKEIFRINNDRFHNLKCDLFHAPSALFVVDTQRSGGPYGPRLRTSKMCQRALWWKLVFQYAQLLQPFGDKHLITRHERCPCSVFILLVILFRTCLNWLLFICFVRSFLNWFLFVSVLEQTWEISFYFWSPVVLWIHV